MTVALGVSVDCQLLLLSALFAKLRFFDSKRPDSAKTTAAAPPNLKITRLTPDLHALGHRTYAGREGFDLCSDRQR